MQNPYASAGIFLNKRCLGTCLQTCPKTPMRLAKNKEYNGRQSLLVCILCVMMVGGTLANSSSPLLC